LNNIKLAAPRNHSSNKKDLKGCPKFKLLSIEMILSS
jgi:hypothetical protein